MKTRTATTAPATTALIRHARAFAVVLAAAVTGGVLVAQASSEQAAPHVTIDSGVLEGVREGARGHVAAFKGIPYAAPPTGEWRWKAPRPAAAWTGVRAARELGPVCPQPDRWTVTRKRLVTALGGDPSVVEPLGPTSEDCLSLNVWTTNLPGKGAATGSAVSGRGARQPVMVWIHGGAYAFGYGGQEPAALAPLGVVVVTINYRLGLLGALAHPALAKESPHGSTGTYALLDQIEALRWVQRNIAAFGGDPQRVTLFGHSAGGASVLQVLASPLAKGLVHRAIAQSGGMGESQTRATVEARHTKVIAELGVPADKPLAALRALPPERLLGIGGNPFDPIVDGWALTRAVPTALMTDASTSIPLIIGATSNEAVVFNIPEGLGGYKTILDEAAPAQRDRLAKLYPAAKDEDVRDALIRYGTVRDFVCPARYVAAHRPGRTWLYRVSAPPASNPAAVRYGAYHGADMRYLFNLELGVPLSDAGREVGDAMRRYWVRFAATGDPNDSGLPTWPTYDRAATRHLELGEQIRTLSSLDIAACDILDEMSDAMYAAPPPPQTK